MDAVVAGLSGGNQQKIVLAKWLAASSQILILDEPTRGVDVGAKAEIHALIAELAERGSAILVISSELPEVISLSERIIVLRGGRVAGELPRKDATQDSVLRLMAGLGEAADPTVGSRR
jgi:ABC-type sugar transport system ATPase subunit